MNNLDHIRDEIVRHATGPNPRAAILNQWLDEFEAAVRSERATQPQPVKLLADGGEALHCGRPKVHASHWWGPFTQSPEVAELGPALCPGTAESLGGSHDTCRPENCAVAAGTETCPGCGAAVARTKSGRAVLHRAGCKGAGS